MDTGTLAESIGEGSASSRGCVASALLTADGTIVNSVPEGVAFPATVLTAVQRALAATPGAVIPTMTVGSYQVETARLESGRYLVNLVLPPTPARWVTIPAGRTVRVRVRPAISADWRQVAVPDDAVQEPGLPLPDLPPPRATPEPAPEEPVSAPARQADEPELPLAAATPALEAPPALEALPEPETPPELEAPAALEAPPELEAPEPEVPTAAPEPSVAAAAFEPGLTAAAAQPVAETVQELRKQLITPSPEDASNARTALKRRARGPAGPPTRGRERMPERTGLWRGLLITGVVLVLAVLWLMSPLPRLFPGARATPVPSGTSASASPISSPTPSPVPPSAHPSAAPSPVMLTFTGPLSHGQSGPDVVALQHRLRQLGYFTYPQDTGYFGDATYGAVYTFQQVRLLPATGVADARTVEELNDCDQACANPLARP